MVSTNCTAAIAFQDPVTAHEILSSLSVEPYVREACIFTAQSGNPFARYIRSADQPEDQSEGLSAVQEDFWEGRGYNSAQKEGLEEYHHFSESHLDLARPILINGARVGTVYIRASLEGMRARNQWMLGVLLGSILLVVLMAYLASLRLQRIISGPILGLVSHMQLVSQDKNYAIRAKKESNDEIGILIDGYNDMLAQTQARDQKLNQQRQTLEELVSLRTQELRISEEQKRQLQFQQKIQEAYGKIVTLLNSIDISQIVEASLNEIVPQSSSQWGAFFLHRPDRDDSLALTKSVQALAEGPGGDLGKRFRKQAGRLADRVFQAQTKETESVTSSSDNGNGRRHSLTAFPLSFQAKPLGVLVLAAEQPFSSWNLSFLENTTRQLGVAIHNALTFQELRRQSSALAQSNQQLAQASQMKSEFLANMSHELRTPLNHIIGFTELVVGKNFGELNEIQEEYLGDVLTSSYHLLSLINDILDISKVESGKMELNPASVPVSDLLKGSLTMIKEKALKNGVKLTYSEQEIPSTITADERMFKQVIFNLLSNAVKFTPSGGTIELRAQTLARSQLAAEITDTFRNDLLAGIDGQCGSFLRISVTDTGVGIRPQALKTIFEVFQQEDKSISGKYGGTGLGLALCKQLAELHRGGIWVESTPDIGSTFHFLLPIAQGGVRSHSSDPAPRSEPRPTPLVLVVDDDEKICQIVAQGLKSEGYQVHYAHDGESALTQAADLRPDIVLLDVMLPQKSGWDVLTQLKSNPQTQDIPVVICSGIEDRRQGLALGAYDYLVKPVQKKSLLECLKKAGVASPEATNGQRVLIVHESGTERSSYQTMLEEKGLTVLTAGSVPEGLTVAADADLAMVFHDMVAGDGSALNFARQIKENALLQKIPLVILLDREMTERNLDILKRDLRSTDRDSPDPETNPELLRQLKETCIQIVQDGRPN
jgi:signal transduction histidine kinase/CheY-like chemotaxis protein